MKLLNKISILILSILLLAPCARATSNWKHIENNKINNASVYLQTNTIKKDGHFATYTTRLKMKNVGDYINVIYTDCTDYSSATLGTYEYNPYFYLEYNGLEVPQELTPVDSTSILYNVAPVACRSQNTYNVVQPKKTNKFVKVVKGIGIGIGYILIAPFALLAVILGVN